MPFQEGQSGNPNGRPAGALNKRTLFAKLLEPHAEELISILVTQAKAGDPGALKLCIERLIPRLKSEGASITLPWVDVSQPNALELVRQALLFTLTQQQDIPLESLKVVIELYQLSKEVQANTEKENQQRAALEEYVKMLHRETI